ncbi:hypothetical protein [Aeromicrobium stalagmiti]|uniref:hypothetical protein n=1 Tax=Aeromicrobium stalagmiti TaxID=2738988 RepID=UPI0015694D53|nr:hypothetical protein [Aeromicrobium stalagmiti]NRQ49126.1 hypothetical protein [Aeromicrobium stalagmiti]
MKKTVIALFASLALVLGMGALVSSANAAYPNTVPTSVSAASKSVNEKSTFKLTVKVKAGTGKPGGSVTVVFNGKKQTKSLSGSAATFSLKAPSVSKTTTKTASFSYKPYAGSVFKKSSGSASIKVKNKK